MIETGLVSAAEAGSRIFLKGVVGSVTALDVRSEETLLRTADLVVDWAEGRILKNLRGPVAVPQRSTSEAEALLAAYDDARTARELAVRRGDPPFDRPLTPAQALEAEVYRDEVAARETVLAALKGLPR